MEDHMLFTLLFAEDQILISAIKKIKFASLEFITKHKNTHIYYSIFRNIPLNSSSTIDEDIEKRQLT